MTRSAEYGKVITPWSNAFLNDKSMMSGSGGVYIHDSDSTYIPEYKPGQLFSSTETKLKAKLVDALIQCYRTGLLVNARRHLAVSKVSEPSEICVFAWNKKQVSLAEAETIVKTNIDVYYFRSSLIYNVFRHDYKPDSCIVNNVACQFGRG